MELVKEIISSATPYVVGGAFGYCVAYVTGLKAVRKGMQLILRSYLNEMYLRFQTYPPTADEKRAFEEMYQVYDRLAENGVMQAKHDEVLHMPEPVKEAER